VLIGGLDKHVVSAAAALQEIAPEDNVSDPRPKPVLRSLP
jgi:hypothetical protein